MEVDPGCRAAGRAAGGRAVTTDDAFFRLHDDLPREAPGDEESLSWALTLAGTPARARILDAGCGPGADLAFLSRLRPGASLVGLDLHAPFIDRIRQSLPHVSAKVGDMLNPEGEFDLIWSAGAAYGPGIEPALTAWRNHLSRNGAVAFSDCLWRSSRPSAAAKEFWASEYPGMCDLAGHVARLEAIGWKIMGARWLGPSAWTSYYHPLEQRIAALRPKALAEADQAMLEVLDAHEKEIALWRDHGDDYGYYLTLAVPI